MSEHDVNNEGTKRPTDAVAGSEAEARPIMVVVDYLWIVTLLAAGVLMIVYQGVAEMEKWIDGLLLATAAFLLAFLFLRFRDIKVALTTRSARYGLNSLVILVLLIGVLALVNYIVVQTNYRSDMTKNHIHSLSERTLKVLDELPGDVRGIAFYSDRDEMLTDRYLTLKSLLDQYSYHSDKFEVVFRDPNLHAGLAKKYGVSRGSLVLELGERREEVDGVTEKDVTTGLVKLTRQGQKKLCFLEGHGEKDLDAFDQGKGLSQAKTALQDDFYDVEKLMMMRDGKVPDSCDALVITGPTADLLPQEKDALTAYLQDGGKAMIMVDPSPSPGLSDVLETFGIEVRDDLILDIGSVLFGSGPEMPIVNSYAYHEITRNFRGKGTVFPIARSLSRMTDAEEYHPVELAMTSPNAWGETDVDSIGNELGSEDFQEGADTIGPLAVAIAVEPRSAGPESAETDAEALTEEDTSDTKKMRLVVVGDSDFVVNGYFELLGNGDFFLNCLNWLTEDEELISIRPKDSKARYLTLTRPQMYAAAFFALFGIPATIGVVGIAVWLRRRS